MLELDHTVERRLVPAGGKFAISGRGSALHHLPPPPHSLTALPNIALCYPYTPSLRTLPCITPTMYISHRPYPTQHAQVHTPL